MELTKLALLQFFLSVFLYFKRRVFVVPPSINVNTIYSDSMKYDRKSCNGWTAGETK